MQEVLVTQVERTGHLLCRPKVSDDDENPYGDFLSSLNTYYENRKTQYDSEIPEVGKLCACYVGIEDFPLLWYRGQVIGFFKSTGGLMGKLLLVDEGKIVCVTKARMRVLMEEFKEFPHQVLNCVFHDLVPITLGSTVDLNMTMQKAQKWDSAAIKFIEGFVKGSEAAVAIKIMCVDNLGVSHIILFVKNNQGLWTNFNEMLVNEKYATSKDTDDEELSRQTIATNSTKKNNELNNSFGSQKLPVVIGREPVSSQPEASGFLDAIEKAKQKNNFQTQKQIQEKCLRDHANKEVNELLRLLSDDDDHLNLMCATSKHHQKDSETSDFSDMESTPVPPMRSFKQMQPKMDAVQLLKSTLGQESTDLLTKSFGLSNSCTTQSLNTLKEEPSSIQLKENSSNLTEPFSFNENSMVTKNTLSSSDLVDSAFIMQALSAGKPSRFPTKSKYSAYDDVLVYGKLKKVPYTDCGSLNLPLQMRNCLDQMGFKTPTLLQAHMWPALMAMNHCLGIAQSDRFETSNVLSYTLPILKHLIDMPQLYESKGNGPIAVICVSGWREAQLVYDVCEKLTSCYKNTRVDVRYGGMDNQEERNIRLLNGCEVLIGTVPSLNKMLASSYTNLSRTCHVVFDNVDILVERFTEDIKVFMRTFADVLIKQHRVESSHIVAVGTKWSYGIKSLMKSYLMDPTVVIANKIEAALFSGVPIVVEICNSVERLEHLIGFLETDAVNKNTIVFTNSANAADNLKEQLLQYGIHANAITEFTQPMELKDIKSQWNAALKSSNNVLIMSDNAVIQTGIRNATYIVHYDYPQKKSHFGNRLNCLLESFRSNESRTTPIELLSQVFLTEQDNGPRFSSGLVKLLKRSGQHVPEMLTSMASSSRELKEKQKEFLELCPRLKLFGECSFIGDCLERHTIFPDRDLIGLCPSTGFIKVIILDVISASNFWGRIVEHRLPYDPSSTTYDTTIYMQLAMDLQMYYASASARKFSSKVEKYDVCVIKTQKYGYQRVRIDKVVTFNLERPESVEVFGIDNGFTETVNVKELYVCDEQFKRFPAQAVEIIACCVKPCENGISWTNEASCEIERRCRGETLEGRVQFSLQNTIWVDPLVKKEVLSGVKLKTYMLDVGRDLLNHGFAERNTKHVENLRKLLFDVQGHPIKLSTEKQSLPFSMLDHDAAYLQDDDYEDIYVSAVVHPGLFFVHRAETVDMLNNLDDKIDATMSITKLDSNLSSNTFPIGYICVAQFSVDKKWYRAKVLGVSCDQQQYDIFFVDHGDREWLNKRKVAPAWPDILPMPFQAIQCSFTKITPQEQEWTREDGDAFWDIIEDRLLSATVHKVVASDYVLDMPCYEVELCDTTGEYNKYISHELVFMGIAHGSLDCLQEMFPAASISTENKVYQVPYDRVPDLCVNIYQAQDADGKLEKAKELLLLLKEAPPNSDVLIENGSLTSIIKLTALTKQPCILDVLMQSLQHVCTLNDRSTSVAYDNDLFQTLCMLLRKTSDGTLQNSIISTLMLYADDSWYTHILHDLGLMRTLTDILHSQPDKQLLVTVLESIVQFCSDNESNCAAIRQENGLPILCQLARTFTDNTVLEKCTTALHVLLMSVRNQEHMRDCGGLQDLCSLCVKRLQEKAMFNVLQSLLLCIETNNTNRDYLQRMGVLENLKQASIVEPRYSADVCMLFEEIINLLEDVEQPDKILLKGDRDILSSFKRLDVQDGEQSNFILRTVSPDTAWSQRHSTVTLSIRLRGVKFEETKINIDRINFRTVLDHTEYVLDLELYANINAQESVVQCKGGEVLLILRKEQAGEEWPRLTSSNEKLPFLHVDFDRLDDDFSETVVNADDDCVLFKPGLPEPPKCEPYENATVLPLDWTSTDDESTTSDESDDDEEMDRGTYDDSFRI